jgi:hypothetical protein
MKNRKLALVGALGVCLVGAVATAATGATAPFPSKTTIKQSTSLKMVPNRYVQDGLRWNRDVYRVKSGGTLHLVNSVINEGPHTFSVVAKADLPRTGAQVQNCKICAKLGQAHGADPNTEGPPKFFFLENGVGSQTPPSIDRAGDSVFIGPAEKKNESVDVKVTAPKGKTLYFMCLIHPWMQARVRVG